MRNFSEFLSSSWYIIVAAVVGVLLIASLVGILIGKAKKKKIKGENTALLSSALGGNENVLSKKLIGSRIVLVLKDKSLLDKEKLLKAGVDSFIEMSDKITLVVKNNPRDVYASIFGESSEA